MPHLASAGWGITHCEAAQHVNPARREGPPQVALPA